MNVLDLKEKLFRKALLEWVESIDYICPEEIILKVEQILEERRSKEKAG